MTARVLNIYRVFYFVLRLLVQHQVLLLYQIKNSAVRLSSHKLNEKLHQRDVEKSKPAIPQPQQAQPKANLPHTQEESDRDPLAQGQVQ